MMVLIDYQTVLEFVALVGAVRLLSDGHVPKTA